MAVLEKNGKEEKSQDFPVYRVYNEFISEESTTDDKSFCNNLRLNDECAITFYGKESIILRGLCLMDTGEDTVELCNYFQHWFHDYIRKKFSTKENNSTTKAITGKLFDAIDKINEKYLARGRCICYAADEVADMAEEKDLHYYFINHSNIKCDTTDKNKCEIIVKSIIVVIMEMWMKTVNYVNCLDYEPANLLATLNKKIARLPQERDTLKKRDPIKEASRIDSDQLGFISKEGLPIVLGNSITEENQWRIASSDLIGSRPCGMNTGTSILPIA
ncbi:PIR Superfamily Protein [Plasmodium ovale curtisi]|uniref:PIR Superfamily Protein n=1 Tax=Plasmodium ovale curtisi TaxID=864141 RepID=A0A1A8VKJ6_PLAOA|nr:PIR Superfamily Protein [Plasmodium ovale curtisi]SBT02655.1 PIR Superfamily Protein [Plasmodium ovale curtisi]